MLAAWTNLGASRNRVPSCLGPLYVGIRTHGSNLRASVLSLQSRPEPESDTLVWRDAFTNLLDSQLIVIVIHVGLQLATFTGLFSGVCVP